MQPFGDASPMGLLWTFMGSSKTYTIFCGAVEMVAGVMLFVPRLATLGALSAIGAMTQVFILNISYDVPVKMPSLHMLLMGVLLLAPDFPRLANFFIFNRPTEPALHTPLFPSKRANLGLLALQLALVAILAPYDLYRSHQDGKYYPALLLKPPLYGVWRVDEFSVNGQVHPPALTNDFRWKLAVLDKTNYLGIQVMDGSLLRPACRWDEAKKTLTLIDPKVSGEMTFRTPSTDDLVLDGQFEGQAVHIQLHRIETKFLLRDRGFHWINDAPLSR
jgi:hypothetical protein